jgi:Smg protein
LELPPSLNTGSTWYLRPGHSRYIAHMFEVLVFVYENYWRGDECPELGALERKLHAVGFDAQEIQEALTWLDELNLAARGLQPLLSDRSADHAPNPQDTQLWPASPLSMRLYSVAEQDHLGAQCLGFIHFLEHSGKLGAHLREIVIDRAMAAYADAYLPLDDLKTIVLMVYWSLGEEPDALVLDELCDNTTARIAH